MGERLIELFSEALELSGSDRAAFVERACGNDRELRDELRSLLDAHEPSYLDGMAAALLPGALARTGTESIPKVDGFEDLTLIGAGGMGRVYRARDVVLDRLVALKFMSRPAAEHVLREARAASAVEHPNVAVVHHVGNSPDAGSFIAMAFYEGETVKDIIARGPVETSRAVDWMICVAEGLARAHELGVIHRDIKPANVLVTSRGEVKILDFGVAALVGHRGTGGTPAYMSPEQLRGEQLDGRSDLWSLGVLLFELVTGRKPFAGFVRVEGDESLEVPAQPEWPATLNHILRTCLRTNRDARYESANELLADLRALRAELARPTGEPPRIVVMPFANISPDPENEYFSDGLTEEVISQLTHVRSLRVVSRTSSRRLKGSGRPVGAIATELGVRYVLEGGVRKAGSRLRISAHLVDTRTDQQLWSGRFDGTIEDVFGFQDDAAQGIVRALALELSADESRALREHPIRDARAYELFLRARYAAWGFSTEGLQRAKEYIEAATAIVGENALLLSTLAHILAMYVESGLDARPETLAQVEALAERIFALDESSARGHWLKAFAAFQRADLRAALRFGESARVIEPNDPDVLMLLGYVYAHVGRNEDARELLERTARLDPLTPLSQCMPGFVDLMEGKFHDAVPHYRRMYELDPHSPVSTVFYGWVLAYAERQREALEVLDRARQAFVGSIFGSWATSLGCALRGEADRAVAAISPDLIGAAHGSEMFARALTQCYALAGHCDEALAWLEREIHLGMLNEAYIVEHDRFIESLRASPRFAELVEQLRARLDALE